jgi:hypothetical protein
MRCSGAAVGCNSDIVVLVPEPHPGRDSPNLPRANRRVRRALRRLHSLVADGLQTIIMPQRDVGRSMIPRHGRRGADGYLNHKQPPRRDASRGFGDTAGDAHTTNPTTAGAATRTTTRD